MPALIQTLSPERVTCEELRPIHAVYPSVIVLESFQSVQLYQFPHWPFGAMSRQVQRQLYVFLETHELGILKHGYIVVTAS